MARVEVSLRAGGGPDRQGHPDVELVELGRGIVVDFPFAPKVDHSGLARRHTVTDRVGLEGRVDSGGKGSKVQTFEAYIAHRDPERSVEGKLRRLRRMADRDRPVRWRNFGPGEGGWWRITELAEVDELRQEGTNYRTRVRVSMTLTRDPDVGRQAGPASGGVHVISVGGVYHTGGGAE